jgi:hypothetical protein
VRLRPLLTTPIALAIASLLLFVTGCSEPPRKEIDQAQAAVDLARTAGAELLAAEDYAAATSGVQKARDAVEQRDYRLALSYAIDARHRAQDAVHDATEARKRAQHDIEALYSEVATRANSLQTLLRAAEAARVKPKDLRAAQATLAEARTALQEASTAITLGKFEQGSKVLADVRGKLDPAIAEIEKIPPRVTPSSAPRKGPRPSR